MVVPATIYDAKNLSEIALKSKAYWGYSVKDLKTWKSDLTVSEKMIDELFVHKFIVDDKITGFYILNPPIEKSVELEMLFVHPNYMGKGIGKQLLSHVFTKALQLRANYITLLSDPNAVPFYLSQGYHIVDKKESSIAGRFLPIMKLELSQKK